MRNTRPTQHYNIKVFLFSISYTSALKFVNKLLLMHFNTLQNKRSIKYHHGRPATWLSNSRVSLKRNIETSDGHITSTQAAQQVNRFMIPQGLHPLNSDRMGRSYLFPVQDSTTWKLSHYNNDFIKLFTHATGWDIQNVGWTLRKGHWIDDFSVVWMSVVSNSLGCVFLEEWSVLWP